MRQEFAKLAPGAGIFKKIGPALVRQEHDEASQLVDKRIEFIKKEMYAFSWLPLYIDVLAPVWRS